MSYKEYRQKKNDEVKNNIYSELNNTEIKIELPTCSEICININKLQHKFECENMRKFILTAIKRYDLVEVEFMLELLLERKEQIEYERKKQWANKFL